MDIYQFINSRDIREHLQNLNYQFSSIEAAWLVWHSHNHSLQEKHAAWKQIIDTMPDCDIKERRNTDYHPSLHHFLQEIMDADCACIEAFRAEDSKATYSYSYYLADENHTFEEYHRLFSSLDDCLNTAIRDLRSECEDESDECFRKHKVKVLKRWTDAADDDLILSFTIDKSVWLIESAVPHKPEVEYYGLNGLWFNFPTPFQKGDLIVSAIGDSSDPIVLLEIATEHKLVEYWARRGDYTDMSVLGYTLCGKTNTLERGIFTDRDSTYMDMEFFRGKLSGAQRVLLPLSNLVKDKISLDLFMNAYYILLHKSAIKFMKNWYTEEGLKLAGLIA